MGMVLGLCTLGDSNIEKVLGDPPLIWKVVAPDDRAVYEAARRSSSGLLSRIFDRGSNPRSDGALDLAGAEGGCVDLDKAWHGIHFLLTQTAWEGDPPLNFLVGGGREVGNLDVGYGPARVFRSDEVRAISNALRSIETPTLRARFQPDEMMRLEIYPEIWDRDPAEDDTFSYCVEYFEVLKSTVAGAAEQSLGLVVFLS